MAARCSIWGKSHILILRSIVCEMPFCCPKRVTVAVMRNDVLGADGADAQGDGSPGAGGAEGGRGADRTCSAPSLSWGSSLWENPSSSQQNRALTCTCVSAVVGGMPTPGRLREGTRAARCQGFAQCKGDSSLVPVKSLGTEDSSAGGLGIYFRNFLSLRFLITV